MYTKSILTISQNNTRQHRDIHNLPNNLVQGRILIGPKLWRQLTQVCNIIFGQLYDISYIIRVSVCIFDGHNVHVEVCVRITSSSPTQLRPSEQKHGRKNV